MAQPAAVSCGGVHFVGRYQPNTIAWGQHAPRMHEHATWCPSPPCIYATHPTTRALFIASALLDMECACNQRFDGVQHIYSLCAQMHPEQPVPFHYLLNCQMHYSLHSPAFRFQVARYIPKAFQVNHSCAHAHHEFAPGRSQTQQWKT